MAAFGIKKLAITPPTLGRISIGHVEEKGGKRLPKKDDAFTITSQVKVHGQWKNHPLHDQLVEKIGADAKLRSIPVTVMFDDPNLNMTAEFTAFDKKSRPVCVGDGEKARRVNVGTGEIEEVACAGPDLCPFAKDARCKAYGRLGVQVEGQDDELAIFMFRTTGFNSIRTLQAKLSYFHSLNKGQLAGFPMSLKLRGKSTAQSFGDAIFYVDLEVREGMTLPQAVKVAREKHAEWEEAGIDRAAFEEAARLGLQNGAFKDSDEELQDVLEEFWSDVQDETGHPQQSQGVSSLQGLDALLSGANLEAAPAPTDGESAGVAPESVVKPKLVSDNPTPTGAEDILPAIEDDLFGTGSLKEAVTA